MRLLFLGMFLLLFIIPLSSEGLKLSAADMGKDGIAKKTGIIAGKETAGLKSERKGSYNDSTSNAFILANKFPGLVLKKSDSTRLVPIKLVTNRADRNKLVIKNNFAKNLIGHFMSSQGTDITHTGIRSNSYFETYKGKRITSIRFIRLHPFGTSLQDTSLVAQKWLETTGNHLHMNTARRKLRMQLQFNEGDLVDPLLLAENEKLLRDLNYIEDVSIRLEAVENNPDEVKVIIISKDNFEYGVNLNANANNSNIEFVNENMFGMGHHLGVGLAQKNKYLPEMGIYLSYRVNNILGKFINSSIGYTDTYLKKGWNIALEKQFLTSKEENVGGIAFDHVSKYNFISNDHPIQLDTIVAYMTSDFWFSHAFPGKKSLLDKTIITFRYYNQEFKQNADYSPGNNQFLRDHNFFIAGVSFARRNLYKNNLVYGYGVTEDIPFGHYLNFNIGLDKSQFGTWPYFSASFNMAGIGKEGSYYSGKIAFDGFADNGTIQQGTVLFSGNFFSKKHFAFGDPVREFLKIEFIGGLNRFEEEYLTIDGRFGIRDFHSNQLKGKNRITINLESVRYLKWRFYDFKFTNYIFSDCAFLSNNLNTLFSDNFYAGIGTGLRIYNESLIFKIIDIRLSWFPIRPPEGMVPFGANLQGLTKSRFDDFLGRKTEVIRFQ